MTRDEAFTLVDSLTDASAAYNQVKVSEHTYDQWLMARRHYYDLRLQIIDALTKEPTS
jgi:hypothetical protein